MLVSSLGSTMLTTITRFLLSPSLSISFGKAILYLSIGIFSFVVGLPQLRESVVTIGYLHLRVGVRVTLSNISFVSIVTSGMFSKSFKLIRVSL
jgi:hypothetical protein